jgi:hypothetical protein
MVRLLKISIDLSSCYCRLRLEPEFRLYLCLQYEVPQLEPRPVYHICNRIFKLTEARLWDAVVELVVSNFLYSAPLKPVFDS